MNELMKRLAHGSMFHFGIFAGISVAWLILTGLFFASITKPQAIAASIEKVFDHHVDMEPAADAVASAAGSVNRDAGLP